MVTSEASHKLEVWFEDGHSVASISDTVIDDELRNESKSVSTTIRDVLTNASFLLSILFEI